MESLADLIGHSGSIAPLAESTPDNSGALRRAWFVLAALEAANMTTLAMPSSRLTLETGANRLLATGVAADRSELAFFGWLAISASAEIVAEHVAARTIVLAVMHQLAGDSYCRFSRTASRLVAQDAPRVRRQWATCANRLGRIARTQGQLDDASAWYRAAIEANRNSDSQEPSVHAELGMATVAAQRGNVPSSIRRGRAVLRKYDQLSDRTLANVHQHLALMNRKQARFGAALAHGWAAVDYLAPEDPQQAELIVTLAEIAEDMSAFSMAAAGFESVLSRPLPDRVYGQALAGALRTASALSRVHSTRGDARSPELARAAEAWLERTVPPFAAATVCLALAELAQSAVDPGKAIRWTDEAVRRAEEAGSTEIKFKAETLRETITRVDARGLRAKRHVNETDGRPLESIRASARTTSMLLRLGAVADAQSH